jgi:hypothetical protein
MKPQTIQQTGKIWKLLLTLSVLGILIGVGWVASAAATDSPTTAATTLIAGSFIAYVIARFLAWWNHG